MKKQEQERWNKVVKMHWWVRGHQLIAKELIKKSLLRQKRENLMILDVGCSGGGIAEFLQQFGKVYGFDISFDSLLACASSNKTVIQSDATRIPFKENIFDVVVLLEVAEHIEDNKSLFKEVQRVCKNRGLVFVMIPAYQFLWGSHDVKYSHKRRYEKRCFSKLVKSCGLKIERSTYMHPQLLIPLFFLRLLDKFRKKEFGKRDDFLTLGPSIDKILFRLLLLELPVIKMINFSFGTCIFNVLKKDE